MLIESCIEPIVSGANDRAYTNLNPAQPRRRADMRKCRQCRLDKQRCQPPDRVWPGAKCERCSSFLDQTGHPCSANLSASEQQKEDQRLRNMSHSHPQSQIQHEEDVGVSPPTEEADSHLDSASIHRPYNTENQIPPVEHHTLLLEPSDHRAALRIRPMLRQRLEFLWGDSNTYVGTCSERFSNTMAGFWYYMVQQQAEANDMVNHGLFAFCASDSAINATGALQRAYQNADSEHLAAALKAIVPYCQPVAEGEQWYIGDKITYLPVMATLMTIVAHGMCANSAQEIKCASDMLNSARPYSALFPFAYDCRILENGGWELRIYLADDPSDRGLYCRHDSAVFDTPRANFETQDGLKRGRGFVEESEL